MFITLFNLAVKDMFVYRLQFFLIRLRFVLIILTSFFLWNAAYLNNSVLFGYLNTQIQIYIFFVAIFSSLVLSTSTDQLAGDIVSGKIIDLFLKPVNILIYYIPKDAAEKVIHGISTLIEVFLLVFLLKIDLSIPVNIVVFFQSIILLIVGVCISFLLSIIVSFSGFFTHEVWSVRFLYLILSMFLSGMFFPLSILSPIFQTLLYLTPFPYMFYTAVSVFINPSNNDFLVYFYKGMVQLIILYILAHVFFQHGRKKYGAFGR